MLLVQRARVPAAALPLSFARSLTVDPLEPWVECDIRIAEGKIAALAQSAAADAAASDPATKTLVANSLVFPGLVDAHVHLDKTHTWTRAPNRTGTFMDALSTLAADKENWTAADLRRRAGFALRCAFAHGTRLMRTHVDTGLPWAETSHAVMAELREEWRGRIDLQTVPLCGGAVYLSADGPGVADLALKYGASALGGFLIRQPELLAQIDRLLELADERGVGIDLHVDENGDAAAEVLRAVAEAVLRRGFRRPVVCGHCCNLSLQAPARAQSTIQRVKEAEISIVSLPECNLYLQGRRQGQFPRAPLWRGLTLVNDLWDAGVPVACASDNVRDAFHPYGDYDLLGVYTAAVKLAHLDERLVESAAVVTAAAAGILGRPDLGRIEVGLPANLVVLEAGSLGELLCQPSVRRRRIDGETITTAAPPDWSELSP